MGVAGSIDFAEHFCPLKNGWAAENLSSSPCLRDSSLLELFRSWYTMRSSWTHTHTHTHTNTRTRAAHRHKRKHALRPTVESRIIRTDRLPVHSHTARTQKVGAQTESAKHGLEHENKFIVMCTSERSSDPANERPSDQRPSDRATERPSDRAIVRPNNDHNWSSRCAFETLTSALCNISQN